MRISDWSSDLCSSDLANAARLMAPRAKIVGRTVRARQVDPAHPAPRTRCERIIITPIPGVESAFPFRKGQHLKAAARRKPALALRQKAIEQAVVPVLGQIDDAGARIDKPDKRRGGKEG